MFNEKEPVVTRLLNGDEFSTIQIGRRVETVLFRTDGTSIMVDMTVLPSIGDFQRTHIERYYESLEEQD